MNPNVIVNKLNRVLRRFGPMDRLAYKRSYTLSGDAFTGRTTSATVDVQFDPQPMYSVIGLTGKTAATQRSQFMLTSDGRAVRPSDYQFLFSPTALSVDDVMDKSVQIVLKDAAGNEEVFEFIDYDKPSVQGVVLVVVIYARGEAS